MGVRDRRPRLIPLEGDPMPMSRTVLTALLVLWACASSASGATSASPAKPTAAAPKPAADSTAVATFAMGCFWCAEATFEGRDGVLSVTSGYTGGHVKNPSYEAVGTGTTGHYESIQIVYDPRRTSYAKLLDIFWHNVDPTQSDGQFCDIGSEYRSVIFFHGDAQQKLALETERQIAALGRLKQPIVTAIVAAGPFYPAEDYHQDFYRKNPQRYHEYREGCGRDARLLALWGKLDNYSPSVAKLFPSK
jgi:peptide-methionine (S)-S-oxide reductase